MGRGAAIDCATVGARFAARLAPALPRLAARDLTLDHDGATGPADAEAALEAIAADESQAPALLLEWQLGCLGMKG